MECGIVIDPNGNRTDYLRNAQQDIIEIVQNGKAFLRYKHTVGGTVLEVLDGNDVTLVAYTTDNRGFHASATLASGESYTYAYDDFGNFTDASSSIHKVEQQYVGRRRIGDWRDGVGIEHDFERAGVMLSVFFERFRIEYLNETDGVVVRTPDGTQHRFWRESDGTLARENGNGTGEVQVFDSADRLVSRITWRGQGQAATPTWATRYKYDLEGLLLGVQDTQQGPTRYVFDPEWHARARRRRFRAGHLARGEIRR
jgi:YD repeat-containing protein